MLTGCPPIGFSHMTWVATGSLNQPVEAIEQLILDDRSAGTSLPGSSFGSRRPFGLSGGESPAQR